MAVGCGPSCARILLIIFNVIFWLSGAALLGIGIWMLVDDSLFSYIEILGSLSGDGALVRYAAYVLIAAGGFVLVVGFFGCCGAIKENRCMLGTFIFLMVIIMAAEIAVGVLGIIFKDQILDEGASLFKGQVQKKYIGTDEDNPNFSKAFKEAVNFVNYEGMCCGWDGYQDFEGYSGMTADGKPLIIPSTCCNVTMAARENGDTDINNLSSMDLMNFDGCNSNPPGNGYYGQGCQQAFEDWVEENAIIIIGVGIGIACLELFGFIFAVCLCQNIED